MSVPVSLSLPSTQSSNAAVSVSPSQTDKTTGKTAGQSFAKLVLKHSQTRSKEKVKDKASQSSSSPQSLILAQLKTLLTQAQSQEGQSKDVDESVVQSDGVALKSGDLKSMLAFLEGQENGLSPEDNQLLTKITDLLKSRSSESNTQSLSDELKDMLSQANQSLNEAPNNGSQAKEALSKEQIKSLAKILESRKEDITQTSLQASQKTTELADNAGQGTTNLTQQLMGKDITAAQIEASVSLEKANTAPTTPAKQADMSAAGNLSLTLATLTEQQNAGGQGQDSGENHLSKSESSLMAPESAGQGKEDVSQFGVLLTQEAHHAGQNEAKVKSEAPITQDKAQGGENVASLSAEALSKTDLSLNVKTSDQNNVHVLVKNTQEGMDVSLQAQNDQTTEALQKSHHILSQEIQHTSPSHLEAKITVLPTDTQNSTSDQSLSQNGFSQQGQSFGSQGDGQRGNTQSSAPSYGADELPSVETVSQNQHAPLMSGQDGSRLNISV